MILFTFPHKIWNQILFILMIFGILSLDPSGALRSEARAEADNCVQWEEIRGWRNLGPRWAGGLDQSGRLIALYDLSYPTIQDRIPLGALDFVLANYDTVLGLLRQARGQMVSISGDNEKTEEYKKATEAIQAMEEIKKDSEKNKLMQAGSILPANWWKEIPWKQSLKIRSDAAAPTHFFLSDVNYRAVVKDWARFDQLMQKLGADFLDRMEFVLNSHGGYDFYWSPQRSNRVISDLPAPSQPLKIADLRSPHCGIQEGMLQSTFASLLGQVIGQISLPVVAGFIQMAGGQWMDFQAELRRAHQAMALEMLESVEEDTSSSSPFSTLSAPEREAFGSYLMYSQSSKLTAWLWYFKSPVTTWAKQKEAANSQAGNSESYLLNHDQSINRLNLRFGVGTDSQSVKRLYLLAAPRYWNIFSPVVAIDYGHPNRIRNERALVEAGHSLVKFLEAFVTIPFVGRIASSAYDYLIEGPMHAGQYWEARLSAHLLLETPPNGTQSNWDYELDLIRQQMINPFEETRENQIRLIQGRREAFGISNE